MHHYYLITGSMSSHLSEEKIFTENYAKLCNTLTDIDNLLKFFVQEEIITDEQGLDIGSAVIPSEKVKNLLIHISGPLKAGNKTNFYTMLEIMEKQGTCTTKELAVVLKTLALKGMYLHYILNIIQIIIIGTYVLATIMHASVISNHKVITYCFHINFVICKLPK